MYRQRVTYSAFLSFDTRASNGNAMVPLAMNTGGESGLGCVVKFVDCESEAFGGRKAPRGEK